MKLSAFIILFLTISLVFSQAPPPSQGGFGQGGNSPPPQGGKGSDPPENQGSGRRLRGSE